MDLTENATSSAPALEIRAVSKSFFGVSVLKGVTFSLPRGHVLGLVGENGAGKSTLMNILGGIHRPDGGSLHLHGRAYTPTSPNDARGNGIAFIHQELNLFANLSVAENLFLTDFPRRGGPWRWMGAMRPIDRKAAAARARQLLAAVDLDVAPETPVGALSPGERQLVEIAKALGLDARLVIFDEPTTSLTAREAERLFQLIDRLRREGRAMIYISHALEDVMRLADDIVVLRDGQVVGAGAKTTFTIPKMVAQMVGRELAQAFPPRTTRPSDVPLLQVHDLSQPGVIEGVNLTVHKGEVLGVAGLMGAGRSEMARILFGLDPQARGTVTLDGQRLDKRDPQTCIARGMAFLTESRRDEGLMMEADVRENVALASLRGFRGGGLGLVRTGPLADAVGTAARSVRIAEAKLKSGAVKTLSGGNQQKVVLAKWLLTKPKLFILDEPTRGIDVGAKFEIYSLINQLVEGGAGVLMISSELEELIGMCDRIVVMWRGEVAGVVSRENFDREAILAMALGSVGDAQGGQA